MRDDDVAVELRALGEYTHFSLRFDLVIEVMSPALAIVLMAAAQGVSSHLFVILVELAVANRASVAVFICTRVVDIRVLLDEILVELKPNLMGDLLSNLLNVPKIPIVMSENADDFIVIHVKFLLLSHSLDQSWHLFHNLVYGNDLKRFLGFLCLMEKVAQI